MVTVMPSFSSKNSVLRTQKDDAFKFSPQKFEERFRKAPFLKCFPSTRERKADVFKYLRFKERFGKLELRFRDGLVSTVDLTVEIKMRFQSSPV